MAVKLIPYGQLSNGNYGVCLDNTTGVPLASALEVLATLPAVADADNFEGRLVFDQSASIIYVFVTNPSNQWVPLDGIPAEIGNVNGNPPILPTPQDGSLFYDLDTEVMFVWDGTQWVAIGGRFAAQIIEQTYIGDGVTINFAMGTAITLPATYVEVFWDGVRQEPFTCYNIVGTNVSFVTTPPTGVNILIRSMVSDSLVQNAQMFQTVVTAGVNQTVFSAGAASLDPAGVFVYVDGVLQADGVDYNLTTLDTTITSLIKTGPTVARAVTAQPHSKTIGEQITVDGANEIDFLGAKTITATPTANEFEYSVLASAPGTATGNPIIFYTPASVNDDVVFTTGLLGTETVVIRSLKNAVVAPSTGEVNDGLNLGAGVPLFVGKSGFDLQFKSLVGGTNIVLLDSGTDVTINASGMATFEDRVGINTTFYLVNGTESYVGIRNTSTTVTVDLSGIINDPSQSGRRIVIADESGGAGVNNITIVSPGSLFNGSAAPLVISDNFGTVTLVKDGTNYVITSQTP